VLDVHRAARVGLVQQDAEGAVLGPGSGRVHNGSG
jgi:hypothetical protein